MSECVCVCVCERVCVCVCVYVCLYVCELVHRSCSRGQESELETCITISGTEAVIKLSIALIILRCFAKKIGVLALACQSNFIDGRILNYNLVSRTQVWQFR